jgi:hypothetical protein
VKEEFYAVVFRKTIKNRRRTPQSYRTQGDPIGSFIQAIELMHREEAKPEVT